MKHFSITKLFATTAMLVASQQALALSVSCGHNVSFGGMTSTGLNIRTMTASEQSNSVYYAYLQRLTITAPNCCSTSEDLEEPDATDYQLTRSTSIASNFSYTAQFSAIVDLFDGSTSPATHLFDDTFSSACWAPGVDVIP